MAMNPTGDRVLFEHDNTTLAQLTTALQVPDQKMGNICYMADGIRHADRYDILLEGLRFVREHFPKPEPVYTLPQR